MHDDTITVFNRCHTKTGDVWYPHIITGVELQIDKGNMITKYGAETKDTAKLLVNWSLDDNGNKTVNDITYLPPKEWYKLTDAEKENTITFNDNATYFDFFVLGNGGYNTPIMDTAYAKGFYSELNNNLDYCFAISSVAVYRMIPHFEILAK